MGQSPEAFVRHALGPKSDMPALNFVQLALDLGSEHFDARESCWGWLAGSLQAREGVGAQPHLQSGLRLMVSWRSPPRYRVLLPAPPHPPGHTGSCQVPPLHGARAARRP